MDIKNTIYLFSLIVFVYSCEKEDNVTHLRNIQEKLPGEHIHDMEIDNNGEFYYVTSMIDTTVEIPMWSSSMPCRFYLTRKKFESALFEVLDTNFIRATEILFDYNNNLWIRTSKAIYKRKNETNVKILELPEDMGLLEFITVDRKNNIWAGGLKTGLIKINQDLEIIKYNTTNSELPTNSMTNIHVDKYNNIWISLWNNEGVLKIENNSWIVFNYGNSQITSQNIWCLVTDNVDNLWIGTGHNDPQISLMKFNGINWNVNNPKDEYGNIIEGTVRKLFTDNKKIWIVSKTVRNMASYSNVLVTFDGSTWNRIEEIPEDDGIADIKIDNFREVVWIRMLNKGIIKIDL